MLELAKRVAGDQQDVIWQQLAGRERSLDSVPEADGYIRCRALSILRDELRRLPAAAFTPAEQQQVLDYAAKLVVSQFARAMVRPARELVPMQRAA